MAQMTPPFLETIWPTCAYARKASKNELGTLLSPMGCFHWMRTSSISLICDPFSEMNKLPFSIALIFLLFSCAQYKDINSKGILHDQYLRYVEFLNEQNNLAALDMLSERIINELTSHASRDDFIQYYPIISSVNDVITEKVGEFENIDNRRGCLTLFGFNASNEPTSMNLEFITETGEWKLDYVQVIYHESRNNLPNKVACPVRM